MAGQKKETLLKWVNCFSDITNSVDRIRSLSNGAFFHHILESLSPAGEASSQWLSPWFTHIAKVLRGTRLVLWLAYLFNSNFLFHFLLDHNIDDNIVDFNLAALGNEDELCILIVICMYLVMVKRPCEAIKETSIVNLPMEDQKVIRSILAELVHDDQVTRNRLVEVLQDSIPGSSV